MLFPIDGRLRLASRDFCLSVLGHWRWRVRGEGELELGAVFGYNADSVVSRDEAESAGCLLDNDAIEVNQGRIAGSENEEDCACQVGFEKFGLDAFGT